MFLFCMLRWPIDILVIHICVTCVSESPLSGTLSPTFPFGIQYSHIYSLSVSGGLRIKDLLIYDLTNK